MELLDKYLDLKKKIFEYFGYVEDWVCIPIDDSRSQYWSLCEEKDGSGEVLFHEDKETVIDKDGDHYSNEIYTQRFLPKWVYRGEEYTMIVVDTRTDGNKFLQIFDNAKEIKTT